METTHKETSDTNANEITNSNSNSKKLVEQIPLEGTPFTAIKADDKWFLTMGKYRLTNQLGSLEECKLEAQDASWMRIMQIMRIVIQEYEAEKMKEFEKNFTEKVDKFVNEKTQEKKSKEILDKSQAARLKAHTIK